MLLQDTIEERYQQIMKEKIRDENEIGLLRLLISDFQRRPNLNIKLKDKDVINLFKKFIKNEEEMEKIVGITDKSIYNKKYLNSYLPKQISEEELKNWILLNIPEIKSTENKNKFMGIIMKHFGSSVDGNFVKGILISL